jgi:hypothetical protein
MARYLLGGQLTMRRLSWMFSVLGLVALAGCGGRVIDDVGSGDSVPSSPVPSSTSTSGKNNGKPKAGSSSSLPSHDLGSCTPGFLRIENPDRPCHWLSETGMCFDDSEGACACLCPTDHDSVCAHGFDQGPNSATFIYCL